MLKLIPLQAKKSLYIVHNPYTLHAMVGGLSERSMHVGVAISNESSFSLTNSVVLKLQTEITTKD